MEINALTQISFPFLYIGWVHLSFKGCRVYFFVIFVIRNPVSKQWWPWSDTASDLDLHCLPIAYVLQKGRKAYLG